MYGPKIYTIPSHNAFDDALAHGLVGRCARDPLRFSEGLVLVANDRVEAVLRDAFARIHGDQLPLPRFISVRGETSDMQLATLLEGGASTGDLEPVVDRLERRMSLADLIQATGRPVDYAEAFRIAGAIGKIIDEFYEVELPLAKAAVVLASDNLPPQLEQSIDLIRSVIERWGAKLARTGRVDVALRRERILEQLRRQWQDRPPAYFVCVADIVERGHAMVRLLRTISELPEGLVVLSGLSLEMGAGEWASLESPFDRSGTMSIGLMPPLAPTRQFSPSSKRALSVPHPRADSSRQVAPRAYDAVTARDAMRFQANPQDPPGWDQDEFEVWLAGQPPAQVDEIAPVVHAFEDDDGDHPDDWADDPEDWTGGLEQWDPEQDADDPSEGQGEEWGDDSDPDDWPETWVTTHPQYHLKILLERMGVSRGEVRRWHRSSGWRSSPRRSRTITTVFAAPVEMASWHSVPHDQRSVRGIRAYEAASPESEAFAIAAALREALTTPNMTAGLLTPDRGLARRVVAICMSWGLNPIDLVGEPLSFHPVGSLLLSIVRAATQAFCPRALLTLLQHPLVRSKEGIAIRPSVLAALELACHEPMSEAGLQGLANHLAEHVPRGHAVSDLVAGFQRLCTLLLPLDDMFSQAVKGVPDLIVELRRVSEGLGGTEIWDDAAGSVARDFLADLEYGARETRARIETANFETVFRHLLDEKSIRFARPASSRISILGLEEARVHTPGFMIVAGLNEAYWPSEAETDAWLFPRIRHEIGLPALSEPIGLWTHAMGQALGAPEVLLTRSKRERGGMTRPSHHWLRLDALSRGLQRANEYDARGRFVPPSASLSIAPAVVADRCTARDTE